MHIGPFRFFRGALLGGLSIALGPTPSSQPPRLQWQLIDGKHWQIASATSEDTAVTDFAERTGGRCAPGMVDVEGRSKVHGWGYYDGVDTLQETTCVDWIDRAFPERCARFDRQQWLAASSAIRTQEVQLCIDRFEYPNRRMAYPWIMVSWTEAKSICEGSGKRLCTEAEWTFA
jgi:sulfatase modifying factor 1